MPRPARIREREAAEDAPANDPAPENDAAVAVLDPPAEASKTPPPAGAEDDGFVQGLAERMGWTPRDQWTRDPEKWTGAKEFLERTPEELTNLRERLRRMGQVADDMAAQARIVGRQDAERELSAAIDGGDKDRITEAAKNLAEKAGPDPRAAAWAERNPWFRSDAAARAVALAAGESAAKRGASVGEQLEAAEAEVKRRFPEHFGAAPEPKPRTEAKPPPQVAGGSRVGTGTAREKGWGEIPASDRTQMGRFVKDFVKRGLSEQEAQKRLAASYWRNKGE